MVYVLGELETVGRALTAPSQGDLKAFRLTRLIVHPLDCFPGHGGWKQTASEAGWWHKGKDVSICHVPHSPLSRQPLPLPVTTPPLAPRFGSELEWQKKFSAQHRIAWICSYRATPHLEEATRLK
jgi:hypothetical protein